MNASATPAGGKLWTGPYKLLAVMAGIAAVLLIWRFAAGLGATTAMNDGYPFGLWIAFDVVTGTALACGGYAVAILVYVLNKGRYHPLVRPAILTSALGYTIGGLSVLIDVGRPWLIYRVPIYFWRWNLDSALLEVALCITAYIFVLWIELSPALLERWTKSERPKLARFTSITHDFLEKTLIWVIALGLLLPTMHQSSLGSVMMLAGTKLHLLWHTASLPLLFLLGAVTMGYGVVVMESALASSAFKREPETRMLSSLYSVAVGVTWIFVSIRILDLIARGRLGLMLTFDLYGTLFWLEIGLLMIPVVMYHAQPSMRSNLGFMFRAAFFMVAAGALYRFNTYLVAFNPGENWSYFPAVPEILVTLGLIAAEIMAYVYIVKRFPILGGRTAVAAAA